jgi:hypothetical protein
MRRATSWMGQTIATTGPSRCGPDMPRRGEEQQSRERQVDRRSIPTNVGRSKTSGWPWQFDSRER